MSLPQGKNGSKAIMAEIAAQIAAGKPLPAAVAVASLPSAASSSGLFRRCTNGNAGQPCIVFSDGANWKVIAFGANASAT